jgi:hypothetical protein
MRRCDVIEPWCGMRDRVIDCILRYTIHTYDRALWVVD